MLPFARFNPTVLAVLPLYPEMSEKDSVPSVAVRAGSVPPRVVPLIVGVLTHVAEKQKDEAEVTVVEANGKIEGVVVVATK